MPVEHQRGLLDTNIMILRRWIDPAELPSEMAISAITLAELSAGPHEVRRNDEQADYGEHAERGRRLHVLQCAENEFDPIPFDAEAARIYGRISAAAVGVGRNMKVTYTVTVGTTAEVTALAQRLAPAGAAVEVVWNPGFLREGHAVDDTLRPDRLIAGVNSAEGEKQIRAVYAGILDAGVPIFITDPATAELSAPRYWQAGTPGAPPPIAVGPTLTRPRPGHSVTRGHALVPKAGIRPQLQLDYRVLDRKRTRSSATYDGGASSGGGHDEVEACACRC